MSHLIAECLIPNIITQNYPSWFRLFTIRKIWSFHVVVLQRTAMNGNETGTVEYSTELAFNSKLPNLIVLNVAFYMHLIQQFDSARVKCLGHPRRVLESHLQFTSSTTSKLIVKFLNASSSNFTSSRNVAANLIAS